MRQPHPFPPVAARWQSTQHNEIQIQKAQAPINSVAAKLHRFTIFFPSPGALLNASMATVAGGVALNLRAPSSSSSAPLQQRRRRAPSIRCGIARGAATPARGVEEDHYQTLRLAPGATRREVKAAFHRLALQYHPDVARPRRDGDEDDTGVDFQRINVAYQRVMGGMRAAEARLEYWRARYGLADEELDRYRRYLNEDDEEDDWFADL